MIALSGAFLWGLWTRKSSRIPSSAPIKPTPNAILQPRQIPAAQKLTQLATPPVRQKVEILRQILKSKNDNDPRLDTEFNHLSSESKQALEREYSKFPPEAKNERGTVVFLIGKNLATQEDFDFLTSVVKENPCLSLADCSHKDGDLSSHDNNGVAVTLEYSQIVAIKALEKYMTTHPNDSKALDVLHAAEHSNNHIASHMAHALVSNPVL